MPPFHLSFEPFPRTFNVEFVSSNSTNMISWNTTQTPSGNSIYHRVQRTSMESLTEYNHMSEDGVLYFATRAVSV